MKKGTIYYVLAVLALLVAVIVAVNTGQDESTQTDDISSDQREITTIIKVDDTATEYPQTVTVSTTALQALEQLESDGEIDVETTAYDFGVLVDSIDGVGTDTGDNKFWIYSINDTTATVGASEYVVQDGDRILWNYEPAQ